jgi:two-component system alkaline phosphatase synthesis response regulator PhoP
MIPKKILIIDDQMDLVQTLRSSLEMEGHSVLVSQNGEDGLKQARSESPDLILLETMLPKLSGYKVCRLLKFDVRYRHIPILLLIDESQQKGRMFGMETGADEYMTKPIDMDDLMKKVKIYLNNPS